MTAQKRLLDLICAVVLGTLLIPVASLIAIVLLLREGRPILYVSERMRSANEGFALYKFRTMAPAKNDSGVTGGDKGSRVSTLQGMLRRLRLDEIPQLWNVLRGDMSFVGPRPPLRRYVADFPDLYSKVLRSRPGITGLASLVYHEREEALLKLAQTAQETDSIYRRRCIPTKARLDLIYQRNPSVCYDLALMWQTARRVMHR